MKTARAWLALLIGAHLALGLVYAWATPIFEASDEGHHVGVIAWLRAGHGLPVQDPTRDREHITIYAQEGSQPPLYYVIGWLATAGLPAGDFENAHTPNPLSRVGNPATTHNPNLYRPQAAPGETWTLTMALRVLSLVMSCGTIGLSYALAARLTGRAELGLLAATLVAFNPMVLFINASANNDNLVMLLTTGTLVALYAIWIGAGRLSALQATGLGLLLGLAALTKLNGLVLWPIAGLVLVGRALEWSRGPGAGWGAWLRLERYRAAAPTILTTGLITFGVALAVSGWWYARNLMLYGELFGTATMVAIAGPRSIGLWELITQEWYGFFLSYWGVFGGFTVIGPDEVNALFAGLTLAGMLGGALALADTLRTRAWRTATLARGFGLVLTGLVLVTLAAFISWTRQTFASQGRLMFGVIAPLSLGLAYGWLALATRLRIARLVWLAPAMLAVVAAFLPVAVIAPRYQPPAPIAEVDLPVALRRVDATFGEGLELVGYTFDDAPRRSGDSVDFTLYWRARAPMAHDDVLALIVYGRETAVVTQIDTWPGGGLLPTGNLTPGAIYPDHYVLPITRTVDAPTLLTLRIGLWRDTPENRLAVTTAAGEPMPAPALTIGRLVPARSDEPPAAFAATDASWGGVDSASATVRLRGARVSADGGVSLWWEGGGTPSDQTLFAHLLDPAGQQVDQADGPTLAGAWPLTAWVPGQTFLEVRRFNSVTTLSDGPYTLRLGWYDPTTGQRLPAWKADGTRWADDAALIEIEP